MVELHHKKFKEDKTITLILRLRHNVIKTGIRRISLAYSKISLSDISNQLSLDSPEDAEFIVAKAIRDGVIDAQIDHQVRNGFEWRIRNSLTPFFRPVRLHLTTKRTPTPRGIQNLHLTSALR